MKTNELNNGIKEVYAKPSIEVEEMEIQWNYCSGTNDDTSGEESQTHPVLCGAGG